MKKFNSVLKYTAFIGLGLALCHAAPAWAQPASSQSAERPRFEERQRNAVRDYYSSNANAQRCPPGLAKKNNGCMPPGQAKKWEVGQRLPRDVIYHDVPAEIASQLGVPPEGYRYVRVASDILMITQNVGTVIDAIIGAQ